MALFPRLVFRIYSDDDEVCVCVALGEGRLRVTKPVDLGSKVQNINILHEKTRIILNDK